MKTEQYIQDALMELLKKKPIDGISVSEILNIAGTCKGTFYKYYRDKYDLLYDCFSKTFYEELTSKIIFFKDFIKELLLIFEKNSAVVLNAFDSVDLNSIRYYNEKIMADYLYSETNNKNSLSSEQFSFALRLGAENVTDIMIDWLKGDINSDIGQVIELIYITLPYVLRKNMN